MDVNDEQVFWDKVFIAAVHGFCSSRKRGIVDPDESDDICDEATDIADGAVIDRRKQRWKLSESQ